MLIDDYINYSNEYASLYAKSVVLMQVGSFYELYGYSDQGSDVDTVCNLLDIISTRKKKANPVVDRLNPKMAGIPLFVLDKYMDILLDNGYTVILVEQTTPPPEPKREVTRIISPATREIENSGENNYLMCIYITTGSNKGNKFLIGSMTYLDVNTNHSYIYETSESDSVLNLEDLVRMVHTHKPSELIIFTDFKTKQNRSLMELLETYIREFSVVSMHNKLVVGIDENFFSINYCKTVLEKVFKNIGLLSVFEYLDIESLPISAICYTYLLQFVYEHNEKIIKGVNKPIFLENKKHLTMVNNVLENLNIVSTKKTKTSSILSLLNNCKTPLGKRYFKECLINPVMDIATIENRYDMCEYFSKDDLYETCRSYLSDIADLERIFKRITTKSIQPLQFISIVKSTTAFTGLINELNTEKLNFSKDLLEDFHEFCKYVTDTFNLEEMEKVLVTQITKNIFVKGVFPDLDQMQTDVHRFENIFENVCLSLNEGNENNTEFKIEISKGKQKDKVVRTILVTKNRFENMLKDVKRRGVIEKLLKEKCSLTLSDISSKPFSSSNTSTLKISFKDMDTSQFKLTELQNVLKEHILEYYNRELEFIHGRYEKLFVTMCYFISQVDFYCCNAKNALERCYKRPCISRRCDESYIKAEKVRHPLIEVIQTDTPYVANDVDIGTEEHKGMLLYGINSSGKSSYMKSVGINLIMAQAGMYVAAKSFVYYPYEYIFSRIPSGDNLFKNQSTFVAEISELRTILKRCTNRSLVIGDELCSGTEPESAIALIASGVHSLSQKNSSFIFATHLHEISKLDCIKNLKNVIISHLQVHFDTERNCLIFDRTLKEGNGDTLYGLEIAKSLDLPKDFLYFAEGVRKEYTNTQNYIISGKKSVYNSTVYMDRCNICDSETEEIHHITEQQYANYKGIVETSQIHKNSKYNLLNVCSKCHDRIHAKEITVGGYKQSSNGIILEIKNEPILEDEQHNLEARVRELRNIGVSYNKILEKIGEEYPNEKMSVYRIKKIVASK